MKVFVTGATGFIGSKVVPELIGAGHTVLGLTRSEKGAEALKAAGAEPLYGTIEDLEALKAGAGQSDAVIHLAFNHDFSKIQENSENDRRAIETISEALLGTDKPFVSTGGVMVAGRKKDGLYDEDETKPEMNFARVTEEATLAAVEKGVNGRVVRLSQIHDPHRQGLITFMTMLAIQTGVSAYVGDGNNLWAAAHVTDTVNLFRLVLEKGSKGSKWHAVGEEGIATKVIAETIGRRLNLPVVSLSPEEAPAHFGFLGYFIQLDAPASNAKTRERLGWNPTGPGLIEDLENLVVPDSL